MKQDSAILTTFDQPDRELANHTNHVPAQVELYLQLKADTLWMACRQIQE